MARIQSSQIALFALGSVVLSLAAVSRLGLQRGAKEIAGHPVLEVYEKVTTSYGESLDFSADLIFQGRDGRYWASTGGGLYLYQERAHEWRLQSGSLAYGGVRFLWQTPDNTLWAYGAGKLGCLDSQAPEPDSCKGAPKGYLHSEFSGIEGGFWVVAGERLLHCDGRSWGTPVTLPESYERKLADEPDPANAIISEEYDLSIRQMGLSKKALALVGAGLQDSSGTVWLACTKAIIGYDPAKQTWRVYGRPGRLSSVVRIYEDTKRRVWFGDFSGNVAVHDPSKESWTHYYLGDHVPAPPQRVGPGMLPPLSVAAICQDQEGRMIFGTSMGLFAYDEPANKWLFCTEENSGLPSSYVMAIMRDNQGKIWIGTIGGLVVLQR